MAVPVARALRNSFTEVNQGRDTSGLGAVALLMPRYSHTYDVGLGGGIGVDVFQPGLSSGVDTDVFQRGLGVDALAPRYIREIDQTEQAESKRRGWARRRTSADVLGDGPRVTMLGDTATDLQGRLDALAAAMRQAQMGVDKGIPGQDVALAQFKSQYRALSRQLAAIRNQKNAQDVADAQPGVVQTVLDSVRGLGGKVALVAALGVGALVLLPLLTARRR